MEPKCWIVIKIVVLFQLDLVPQQIGCLWWSYWWLFSLPLLCLQPSFLYYYFFAPWSVHLLLFINILGNVFLFYHVFNCLSWCPIFTHRWHIWSNDEGEVPYEFFKGGCSSFISKLCISAIIACAVFFFEWWKGQFGQWWSCDNAAWLFTNI